MREEAAPALCRHAAFCRKWTSYRRGEGTLKRKWWKHAQLREGGEREAFPSVCLSSQNLLKSRWFFWNSVTRSGSCVYNHATLYKHSTVHSWNDHVDRSLQLLTHEVYKVLMMINFVFLPLVNTFKCLKFLSKCSYVLYVLFFLLKCHICVF